MHEEVHDKFYNAKFIPSGAAVWGRGGWNYAHLHARKILASSLYGLSKPSSGVWHTGYFSGYYSHLDKLPSALL